MATRAQSSRAREEIANSARNRQPVAAAPSKRARIKAGLAASTKGRSVHGRTKILADEKAGKPDPGWKRPGRRVGSQGGEEQTRSQIAPGERGADGAPSRSTLSRKSTRGSLPAGEKTSNMTRAV